LDAVPIDTLKSAPRSRLLPRGESVVASAGLALAALLLCVMSASAWWVHHTQQTVLDASRATQTRAAGDLLAETAEVLLAQDDLSAARRLLADTARAHEFSSCRIVLPDGQVAASLDVSENKLHQLPAPWPQARPGGAPLSADASRTSVSIPLAIPGRGQAQLEISSALSVGYGSEWEAMAGVGTIGAAALVVLLALYRRMRRKLRAMGAIREALVAVAAGETAMAALVISPDLGSEAGAWNQVIAETDRVRRQAVAERAREALGRRQESNSDLDAACDALPQGLLVVDEKSCVKYANGAAAGFLRSKRDDLAGKDIGKFLDVVGVVQAVREVATGASRRRQTLDVEQKDDGPAGVLRFTVRPVRRDDSGTAMITIEDITQQRAAEEARHRFVAQATHELRTPLTNIRLYVETAIEDGEADPAMRSKCLNVINGETRRLERIVGEMLSVAEIEAGSFKLQTDDVRLDQLFEDLLADYQQQALDKNVALTFHLPPKFPVVQGDRDKILLALHNLVGNALKYTPETGKVDVVVEATEKLLSVQVRDTGIGISDEDAEKIFDRFYRARDPRVAKITGSGLGLTLAREVVRLHGGDVTVESRLNQGSTFTITLPMKTAA
jgi:PAS domain S-box-containing protein